MARTDADQQRKYERSLKSGADDRVAGVRIGEVFELYVRRIDRIDNWDLVDRDCVGSAGPRS